MTEPTSPLGIKLGERQMAALAALACFTDPVGGTELADAMRAAGRGHTTPVAAHQAGAYLARQGLAIKAGTPVKYQISGTGRDWIVRAAGAHSGSRNAIAVGVLAAAAPASQGLQMPQPLAAVIALAFIALVIAGIAAATRSRRNSRRLPPYGSARSIRQAEQRPRDAEDDMYRGGR